MSAPEAPALPPPADPKRLSRTTKAIIIVVLVVVAGTASYGVYALSQSATTSSCPHYTNSTGQIEVPNNPTLIANAKGEGTVKWITTTNPANASQIAHDFTCDFPWATVNVDSVQSATNVETAIQGEFAGNDHTIDVASTSLSAIVLLNSSGMIQNYVNPVAAANLPAGNYDPAGLWSSIFETPYGIAYNTQLLTGSAIPTSWSNLTEAMFSNELTMDDPATLGASGTTFAGLYLALGNATWHPLMEGIANNNPVKATGSETAISYVVEGLQTVAVGVAYSDTYQAEQSGGPVAFEWLNPTPVSPSVQAMVGHAPDPYMAELFEQWMVSGHGQQAWSSTGRASIIDGGLHPPIGIELIPVTNLATTAEQDQWTQTYTDIFGP